MALTGIAAVVCGGDGRQCPHDPDFEHRPYFPYLGSCVPKDLSDNTGRSRRHRQTWDPEYPNPLLAGRKGRAVWDGGCDKHVRPK